MIQKDDLTPLPAALIFALCGAQLVGRDAGAPQARAGEIKMSKSQTWSPKAAELYFKESIIGQLSAVVAEALARRSTAAEDARKAAARAPRKSSTEAAAAPVEARKSLLERLDAWQFRQAQREREAYLARSKDVFDLERRMRSIDRGTMGRYY
ncbi:MAG: DUF3563 family protein [Casimicrobiaceae bacterium]